MIKPDKILMTSAFESFKNYENTTQQIVVSGSVPDVGKDFFIDIPTTRGGTIAYVYVNKVGSSTKRLVSYAAFLGEFVDATLVGYIYLLYNPTYIRVNISIANGSGGPITPSTQTFNIQAVIFDAPVPT